VGSIFARRAARRDIEVVVGVGIVDFEEENLRVVVGVIDLEEKEVVGSLLFPAHLFETLILSSQRRLI
jgi:hypothetical protein